MRTIVFAYHQLGYLGLTQVIAAGFDVMAVVTHPDSPGEEIFFESVEKLARSHKIPVHLVDDKLDDETIRELSNASPEILFSFYYRKMLPQAVLDIAPRGGLNLHGSMLPRYRGRSPVNWVLVNGEPATGVTLHYMDAKPDHGDIVAQRGIPILPDDTALTLYTRMGEVASGMLGEVLPLLRKGSAPRIPQDHKQSSYFGGRKPSDGKIDWNWPAERVRNLVRAVTKPWPGAFAGCRGKTLLVWSGSTGPHSPGEPGRLVPHGATLAVSTGDGVFIPLEVTWGDGDTISWDVLIRTAGLGSGDRLEQDFKTLETKSETRLNEGPKSAANAARPAGDVPAGTGEEGAHHT